MLAWCYWRFSADADADFDVAGPERVTVQLLLLLALGAWGMVYHAFQPCACTDAAVPFPVFCFQPPFSTLLFPHAVFRLGRRRSTPSRS